MVAISDGRLSDVTTVWHRLKTPRAPAGHRSAGYEVLTRGRPTAMLVGVGVNRAKGEGV